MAQKEVINRCKDIWNDSNKSYDEKIEEITAYLINIEQSFSKSKVKKLLRMLTKEGIEITETELWNEIR